MNFISQSSLFLCLATAGTLTLGLISENQPALAHTHDAQASVVAQSPTPVTYVTRVGDPDQLVIQITEGEFRFHGYLERTLDDTFVGEDDQVRVTYDRSTGRVVVINVRTGDEYYNYFFSEVDEGSL